MTQDWNLTCPLFCLPIVNPDPLPKAEMAGTEGTVGTERLKDITLALFNDRLNWADQMGIEKGAVGPRSG